MQHRFYSSTGSSISLAERLGVGGEGAVFSVAGSGSLVCKVYHKPLEALREAKLRAMASAKASRLQSVAAWPIETVHKAPGAPVAGFLMPRVLQCEPIHKLYSPHDRKKTFIKADWRFLIAAARNACAAMEEVHSAGCVIGDVNENGLLVDQQAMVRLIDCDSFQFTSNGQTFLCRVGVAPFTPPELIGRDFEKVPRARNHDSFGLAVHIFHLLMMGRHPFAGKYSGSGEMPIERAIATFSYAYGRNASTNRMAPPPNSVPISALPSGIVSGFERAFLEPGVQQRPTPTEWERVLAELFQNLRKCGKNGMHYFYNGLSSCPWCHLEDQASIWFFVPFVQDLAGTLGIDIANLGHSFDEKLRRIRSAPKPRVPAFKDPASITCAGRPVHAVAPASRISGVQRLVARVLGTLVLLSMLIAAPQVWFVYLALAWGLFWLTKDESKAALRAEVQSRYASLRKAQDEWDQVKGHSGGIVNAAAIDAILASVSSIETEFRALPKWKEEQRRKLDASVKERQLLEHLDQYELKRFKIPGFGPTRITMLRSYNIETAADVTRRSLAGVPGIGNELAARLISWRQQQEQRFRFDPKQGVTSQDLARLDMEYKKLSQALNDKLSRTAQQLATELQIGAARAQEVKQLGDKLAGALAQTQADWSLADEAYNSVA